jgi:cyclophilin family peptidyl-prolyl cis-trans isomerase
VIRALPAVVLASCVALSLPSCENPDAAPADAAASAPPVAAPAVDREGPILAAEHRRIAALIGPADQQSRDVAVRRAAARALSRIGGEAARAGLLRALADEDDEVIAWGAYGLGFACKGHEKEHVAAIVARALGRSGGAPTTAPGRLDAAAALARAVGRCGADESEPTLVAWLGGPREGAVAAAFALGDLGSAKQKLREETLAALLNLAAGSASSPPVPEALFPVGRLEHVPLTVVDRIREVAAARLATPGEARLFAVRALGRAGDDAAPELARVLTSPASFNAAERAEAARALKRLGRSGQRVLASALPTLAPSPDPVALTGLVGDEFGVLLVTLESIVDPAPVRRTLVDLASLPPPPSAPPQIARRISSLRCAAAKLLAGADFHDKLLAACDVTPPAAPPGDAGAPVGPAPGSIGARAMVEVIGRGELTGARLAAYRGHARGGDLRAREAAIELLAEHEEVEGAAAILAEALGAKESGLVATAAEVITKQPQRAMVEASAARKPKRRNKKKVLELTGGPAPAAATAPSPALVKALLDLLARPATLDDPEMADTVIDAVGALALKEAKPRLDELCRSSYPTTREHAQKAIALVSGEKKACEAPPEGGPAPAELDHLARAPIVLSLDTEAGALTVSLDPALAPVMATRVADLARAGYYEGMVVHRVVPGFVTQFGAPFGDGFGGPEGKPAVRCETSPLPFAPLAVGVALSGRDTGSSQIFVMHGRHPHLDGGYAIVGTAGGPWGSLAEGDVIRHATVKP